MKRQVLAAALAAIMGSACGGAELNVPSPEENHFGGSAAELLVDEPLVAPPTAELAPLSPPAQPPSAPQCDQDVINKVLGAIPPESENPPDSAKRVSLKCSLTLKAGQVVKKRILLEGATASNITIDCGHALLNGGEGTPNDGKDMIEIKSTGSGDNWSRPSGIKIRNCQIIGSMRIYGRGKNGEAAEVRESSRRDLNHPSRLQSSAPTNILLEGLTITATSRTPLYLAPGVTGVRMIHSELKGKAKRTGLYLDAESAFNTFKNNRINVSIFDEWGLGINRLGPQVSLDTSRNNKFINNTFAALEGGGIYAFRNCGEGGTIRHGSSSNNQIINNIFYYNKCDGGNPSVLLGARGEWYRNLGLGHCDDDESAALKVGSNLSNDDHARNNVVMQNQTYKLPYPLMIREGDGTNSPNILELNETVTTSVARRAGCFIQHGYKNFIQDGERLDAFLAFDGTPVCTGTAITCADGELVYSATTTCSIVKEPFFCQVTGSNSGCAKTVGCPAGRKIVAAKAACNLEFGTVSSSQISDVPFNTLAVVRPSDTLWKGTCSLAGASTPAGETSLKDFLDRRYVSAACKEDDDNGGDCDIRGVFYCR